MDHDSVVLLNGGYKSRMVRVGEIVTIEVEKNDLNVRLMDNTTYVMRGSLVRVLKKLPECFFVACRNCVVNLLAVGKVDASARMIVLKLSDGREIMVSKKQSIVLRQRFTL